ncbi:hypothetical protein [Nocardioides sp. WS12]|uniref:hypothetical protein n=1 Tax=Nocardioides sp. WS12 TaxID=2486272 RepID=UPI0015FCBFA6|nr:hypothetical protein [Nocardioides sp. WS12]
MDLRVQTAGPWSWWRAGAFALALSVGFFVSAKVAAHSFWSALAIVAVWNVAVLLVFGILDRRRSRP